LSKDVAVRTANAVYFPALDGIRALALVMVFLAHYAQIPLFGLGVNVFFVLSGSLITGILIDTREQRHRIHNFYVRRTLRIFPLYYGILLALFLLTPVLHWKWDTGWLLWPAYVGNYLPYLHPWLPDAVWHATAFGVLKNPDGFTVYLGHFWSLCVEEQFYLLWPWLVFFLPRRALLWICGLMVVLMPLVRVIASHHLSQAALEQNVLFRTLPFQLDSLLLGGLIALLWRGSHRDALIGWGRIAGNVGTIAALMFVYCCVDLHLPFLRQPFLRSFHYMTWELSVINLLSAAWILSAMQPGSWVYRFFHLRPLRWTGRISYGAYVLHDLPHEGYVGLGDALSSTHGHAVTMLLAASFTLVGSALSYRFFEKPFLKLKDRWTLRNEY